jgi:protein-disulfide isomerase
MISRLPRAAALGVLLPALLGATPGRAAEQFTPDQQRAIEQIVRDYLVGHPEVLMEALQAAEEKMREDQDGRAKQALATRQKDLFDDPASPVGGNPNGDVTVVEFFDYRCPYCKQVHPAIIELLGQDKGIRFIYKEFPILGKESVFAGRAALAAQRQGKYQSFHDALMSLKGQLSDAAVLKAAASAGLDVEKLKADMESPEIADALKRTYELAQALEIRGTPAFVIGGKLIPGAVDAATLKKRVLEARKG